MTVAIGECGRYSAIRDWLAGDIDRRDLRPIPADSLVDVARQMYETADRDEQQRLSEGLTYLFGQAECPHCADVFAIAKAYAAASKVHRSR